MASGGAPDRRRHHAWKRFWCRRGMEYSLGDAGYLYDPESELSRVIQPHAVSLEQLESKRCIVLLGEPGIGKSVALADERSRLAANGAYIHAVELLRATAAQELSQIFEVLARSATNPSFLLLDGLDEASARNPNLPAQLVDAIEQCDRTHLRLRISCRALEWPSYIEEKLNALWPGMEVYELLPLRRTDVRSAAEDYQIDPDEFVKAVQERDSTALAIRPVSLRFLLEMYAQYGTLAHSKLRLFDQGTLILCNEESTWHHGRGRPHADAFRCRAIAARIAAVGTFTNRHGVAREGLAADAVTMAELAGGVEGADGASYDVTVPALEDTLAGTALFSAGSPNSFVWTHQSYREFLSAWYVGHRDLPQETVASLYFPNGDTKRVPGPLREVAAWHATLVPAVFDLLVLRDPEVLLHSDSAAISEASRMQLTEALLRRMDEFEADDRAYWENDYRKLGHGDLAAQLRPYIRATTKNPIVRRAAMDIAWSCRVAELVPVLSAVLEDPVDNIRARESAAYSLSRLGGNAARAALARVLAGDLAFDVNDEVRGAALNALWPDHINLAKLFEYITARKRENLSGGYAAFLDEMPGKLPRVALPQAITWVEEMGDHPGFDSIGRAQAQILSEAFAQVDDPVVLALVVRIVGKFVKSDTGIVTAYHSNEELYTKTLTDDRRRTILYALLTANPGDKDLGRRAVHSEPLMLRVQDLSWLAETAMVESDSRLQAALGRLANVLYATSGTPTDAAVADTVARAVDQSAAFRGPLADLFAPIELVSPTADRLRDQWNTTQASIEHRAAQRATVEAARAERFREQLQEAREALVEIEAGKIEQWLTVYQMLAYPRDGSIRGTPGWQELAVDQERIIQAATAFLNAASPPSQAWMDDNSIPLPVNAARAAFILIGERDREALTLLSDAAWRQWGYVMVAVYFPSCPEPLHIELTTRAYDRGLENVIEAVRRISRREDRQNGHVMVFDRLPLPLPNELQSAILDFVDELGDRGYADAMVALVASGSHDARARALSALADGSPSRAAHAARALLPVDEMHWKAVLQRMEADREFAWAVAELLSAPSNDAGPFSTADDQTSARLAFNLFRIFPPEADPERPHGGLLTVRDNVARLRDGLVELLVKKGTPSAVSALEWLVSQEPGRDFLRWQWMRARGAFADVSWKPLRVAEFLSVVRVLGIEIVVDDGQPRHTLVFDTNNPDVARISAFLSANIKDIAVRAPSSAGAMLVVDAAPEAIARLVAFAESGSFNVTNLNARLLGIRFGTEWLFEEVPSVHPAARRFRDVSVKELKDLLGRTAIVLATATDIETCAVLSAMDTLPGEDRLLEGSLDVTTYRVGLLGRYIVAHLQCAMGSTGVAASQISICDAIHEVNPKVVFMIGIAFGLKRSKQRLGDVLIAEHITGYEMVKLRPDTIDERGPTIPGSIVLTERFKSRVHDWTYTRADGTRTEVVRGRVLSGEKLVNNREFSAALVTRFPDAIGGEMEGVGAYAVAARRRREILLVKSICDWADGLKNDRAQAFAAATATSLVRHILDKRDVLDSLDVPEYDVPSSSGNPVIAQTSAERAKGV